MTDPTEPDIERSREERLKALVRKDVHPRITELAKRALRRVQEDGHVGC